jgi:hypothetical protein
MWMTVLFEKFEDDVEALFQLQIAFGRRNRNNPKEMNWVSIQH